MKRFDLFICLCLALCCFVAPAKEVSAKVGDQSLIVPEISSSHKNGQTIRKEYPTIDSVIALQDSLAKSRTAGLQTRSSRDLSLYAVGSIPISESVSPSGARVYRIPISTAQGWELTPSISLVYNSQAGNNVAGYGWGIGGLSSITVRNKNLYYENIISAGLYDSPYAKYALDGIPLVTSAYGPAGFELSTAKGNVHVRRHENSLGQVLYFTAIYPDGSTARYGAIDNTSPRNTYPISLLTDKDGNTITFEYTIVDNVDYISSIHYGSTASISFNYTTRSNEAPYGTASFGQTVSFPRKLLDSITSYDGNSVICEYSLNHQFQDRVSLLKEIRCCSAGEELPPLEFSYGVDDETGNNVITSFNQVVQYYFAQYFNKTDDVPLQYHRGKLIPCSPNDGIVVLPDKSNYVAIDSATYWFTKYYKYGSDYNAQQLILCNNTGENSYSQSTIVAGSGFQLIEAVDVDGDGTDELVKINNSSTTQDVTDYTITVYSFGEDYNYTSRQFTVSVSDGTHNRFFKSPAKSYYRFGNFRGDGTTMLMIMTRDASKFALVDLNEGTKLIETTLFTNGDDEENLVIVADFENDGKSDLCHVTTTGMDVYSLSGDSSNSFGFRTTYSGVTKSQLYYEPNINHPDLPQEATPKIYVVDINGDGYPDIASAPLACTIGGVTFSQFPTWNISIFNGKGFSTESKSYYNRKRGDIVYFLDVDRDGLPDMLHQNYAAVWYYPNLNAEFNSPIPPAYIPLDSLADVVPGDCSMFGTSGDVIIMSGPWMRLYELSPNHVQRRSLTHITDSFGNIHSNTYSNSGSFDGAYLMDPNRTYNFSSGFVRLRAPFRVLSRAYNYDADQHTLTDSYYTYWDAVYHSRGLGFCGFGKMCVMDYISRNCATTVFDPQRFGIQTSETVSKGYYDPPYSTVTNTYDNNTTAYGKLNPRLIQSVAADSLYGITTTTSYTYGDYDLPMSIIVSRPSGSGPAFTEGTHMTYQNTVTPTKYILGLVTEEILTRETDGDATSSWLGKTINTYDNSGRLLTSADYIGKRQVTQIPINLRDSITRSGISPFIDVVHLVSSTRLTYNSHGNITSEKTAPYGATTFTGDTLVYDANGRYLLSKTDALGHTTTYSNYNKFGKPTTVTDYRNRSTTYTYDSWGNLTQVSHPDGGVEQMTTAWGGDGLYTVTHTATGSPETITHYDALGREIKSGVKRFDGVWQFTNKEYDSKGRLSRVSLPYRATTGVTGPSYWNTYHYDIYDRPDSLCEASGRRTRWSYNGTSTTTIKDGISITRTTDAMGRVVSTSDSGGTVTYTLRDDGQPSSITAPGNVVTTFTYDAYGRRTQMVDPSLGTESDSYTWNADGSSVFTHINRNGTVATSKDRFGRVTYVSRAGEFNTTYTYDTYGRLSNVSSTNGTGKEYTYDAYDRVATFKETVPNNKWLQKTYTYSTGSVLSSIAYTSQSGYITTETYTYANGHNTGITLPNNKTVWSLVSENDLGQPTEITTGQQTREYGFTAFGLPTYRRIEGGYIQNFTYQFDPATGNLLGRGGYLGSAETFGYDNLNRLTSITKGNTTRQIVYQDNGNITSIDGVGTLIYGGGPGVSPYEVTGLTPESGQPSYRQRTVTYNSFDRPAYVVENTMDYPEAHFTYNADGERVFADIEYIDGHLHTQYYIGGRYEYDNPYGTATERLYLGGDAYSAPMVYQKSGNGSWTLYNIGRDYLGSITSISDESDGIIAVYRYDPWGRLVDFNGT
ncbi:MAG: hypothetical protein J5740_01570, partial [Bacteroidales bacterium]|nr:hypothetical protein [Bacteroidales bacterium]